MCVFLFYFIFIWFHLFTYCFLAFYSYIWWFISFFALFVLLPLTFVHIYIYIHLNGNSEDVVTSNNQFMRNDTYSVCSCCLVLISFIEIDQSSMIVLLKRSQFNDKHTLDARNNGEFSTSLRANSSENFISNSTSRQFLFFFDFRFIAEPGRYREI